MLYEFLKILNFLDHLYKSLYCTLARPILEYGSVVWNTYTAAGSNQLERVQRKFLSVVGFFLGIPHGPHDYSPVAKALGLYTVAKRRHMLSFKFFNDLLLNKIDSLILLLLVNFTVPFRFTRSNITFYILKATINYQQYEPLRHLLTSANNDPTFLDSYSQLLISWLTVLFSEVIVICYLLIVFTR